jgi:hypothetical protein
VKVSALTTMPVIATTPQSADAAILLFLLAIIAIFSFLVQKMGSNIPKAASIRNSEPKTRHLHNLYRFMIAKMRSARRLCPHRQYRKPKSQSGILLPKPISTS